MWENKTQSVPQRIVSLTQPHIRPIVRGKAGKPIEFGAKLSVSCVDNYVFLDKISWENFNESCHLKEQVVQIVAIACEECEKSDRPVSHWTPSELADEAIKRGIVEKISPRSVGRFLKRSDITTTSRSLLVKCQN